MLLQFTVENVLSFREEAVLSLLAAPGVEHAPGQVVEVEGLPRPVLRVVALYGANASGKSNLVHALQRTAALVVVGTDPVSVRQRLADVERSLDELRPMDERWLCLDLDHWGTGRHTPNLARACKEALEAGYALAVSNPAFVV